jgi:hypothetical protein
MALHVTIMAPVIRFDTKVLDLQLSYMLEDLFGCHIELSPLQQDLSRLDYHSKRANAKPWSQDGL